MTQTSDRQDAQPPRGFFLWVNRLHHFVRRYLPWFAGVILLALFVIVFGMARMAPGETSMVASVLVVALMIVLLFFACIVLSAALAGVDAGADDLARLLTSDALAERLMERWLHRVRWRRWVAGLLGLIVGLFLSSSVNEDLASAAFVYPALASVSVASISAELHLLRGRSRTSRIAELSVRQLREYANRVDQTVMTVVALAAFATAVWALLLSEEAGGLVAAWSGVAMAVVLAAFLMQRQVVERARPAVTPELRAADDLLRSLAVSRGVARPAISLALVTIGVAFRPTEHEGLEAIAWVLGLGFWWFNRGLGIRRFARRRAGAEAKRSAVLAR